MEYDLPIRDEWPQYVSATIAQIDMPRPFHIAELPVTSVPNLVDGIWMVDHKIDRHNNLSTYSNIRHWWRIPRRIGVARLFVGTNNNPRITNDGYIVAPVSVKETQLKLELPEDAVVFRTILHAQDWFPPDDLRSQFSVAPVFQYSRFSNEGRYLDGTLRLFGDLQSAYQVVECRFWRNIFYELGALSRGNERTAVEEVVSRIRPRLGEFDAQSAIDWQRLGKAVLVEAGRVRLPSFQISFPDLKRKWEVERDEAMRGFSYDEKQGALHLQIAEESFETSVRSLCAHSILTQGHQWTCRRCAHKNWNSIDDISHTLKCEVCRVEFQIDPDFRWDFHLNEFLARGIREHGHLALVWAIGALLRDTRDSFLFSPPLALYLANQEKARPESGAELDILCVRDGRLAIGEVKSSERDFTKKTVSSAH